MPLRPRYKISPADRIAVEVRQPDDGGCALVIGKLDSVPEPELRRYVAFSS